jgi:dTDP-4-dehydrorhamnose reductase
VLSRHHNVCALTHSDIDLRSRRSIARALDGRHFDRAILTAAMTDVDDCERNPRLAHRINADAPGWIARTCQRIGAHLTFLSTDFVFPGNSTTPLSESSPTGPVNAYGASKLAGEHHVLDASTKHLVTRVSWLFGGNRPSFPEWLVHHAATSATIPLAADTSSSPTYIPDLAHWLASLTTSSDAPPPGGVLHLCNAGACSWADWGNACLHHAKAAGAIPTNTEISPVPASKIPHFSAPRPAHTSLDTSKFTSLTHSIPRHWKSALCEFFGQFPFAHPDCGAIFTSPTSIIDCLNRSVSNPSKRTICNH